MNTSALEDGGTPLTMGTDVPTVSEEPLPLEIVPVLTLTYSEGYAEEISGHTCGLSHRRIWGMYIRLKKAILAGASGEEIWIHKPGFTTHRTINVRHLINVDYSGPTPPGVDPSADLEDNGSGAP